MVQAKSIDIMDFLFIYLFDYLHVGNCTRTTLKLCESPDEMKERKT